MARYHNPSIREQGLKVFINTTFANLLGEAFPDVAYPLLEHMITMGVNSTNIGKTFNGRGPGAVDNWKIIRREEMEANRE